MKTIDFASRRKLLKVGLGTVGALASTPVIARICGVATGQQPLGPFFPRPGTPEDPVREDPNPQTPISLANDNDLTFVKGRNGTASGQVVHISGVVSDERCQPVANATIVVWQASERGRYNHRGDADNQDFRHPRTGEIIKRTLDPFFQYWGRAQTNEKGEYTFKTIVPGFYPADLEGNWYRPPHIHFMISALGFPQLVTQMYFEGDEIPENDWIQELNRRDLLLQSPNLTAEQKEKLIVKFQRNFAGNLVGSFDVTLTR